MFKVVTGIFVLVCLWTFNACSPKVSKSASSTVSNEKLGTPIPPTPPTNVAPVPTQAGMHEPIMMDADQPKPVPASTLPMEKVSEK